MMSKSNSVDDQLQSFVTQLTQKYTSEHGIGSMSPSIYDTAWLSMVEKEQTWLFPQCFDFILANQLSSGAWEAYASPVDGILNTAAALLAIKKRLKTCPDHPNWLNRCQRAESALRQMLETWDISSCDQVGFEILVVKHLSLLEDEGIMLHFDQLDALKSLRDSKLARLPPEYVYKAPSTLYHTLEALIGHIDFDQVRRWRDANGSMMGSPSSTAAYLMHASVWDDDAEAYLGNVLEDSAGKRNGSVPCAWPTTIFEITWVVKIVRIAIAERRERMSSYGYLVSSLKRF